MTFADWLFGLRLDVSLLLEAGYPNPWEYPVGYLMDEARIVLARRDQEQARHVGILRMAVASLLDRKAANEMKKVFKRLTRGVRRHVPP